MSNRIKKAARDIFLLLLLSLFPTLTASAEWTSDSSWYVTLKGDFNGWSNNGDVVPDANGIVTQTRENSGGFEQALLVRIWDGGNEICYGSGAIAKGNTAIQLSGNNGKMRFAADAALVTSMTAVFDCVNKTLQLNYSPVYPDEIYIIGTVGPTSWAPNYGIAPVSSANGVYEYKDVEFNNSGDGYGYFRIATKLSTSDSWDTGIKSRPHFGSTYSDEELSVPSSGKEVRGYAWDPGGAPCWKVPAGVKYDITVDLKNSTLSIAYPEVDIDDDEEVIPGRIFMLGHVEGHNWDTQSTSYSDSADGEPGIFRFNNILIDNSGDGYGYIRFVKKLGDTIDVCNQEDVYGATSGNADPTIDNTVVRYSAKAEMSQHAPNWRVPAGYYDITLDLNNKTLSVTPRDYPESLFIIGRVNGYGWDIRQGVRADVDHGVYTFENVKVDPNGSFNIITCPSPDKINDIWGKNRYAPEAGIIVVESQLGTPLGVKCYYPGAPEGSQPKDAPTYSMENFPNEYFNMVLDLNAMTITITRDNDHTEIVRTYPDTLYLIGDVNNTMGSPIHGMSAPVNAGTTNIYEFKSVKISDNGSGYGEFSFTTVLADRDASNGTPEDDINASDRYGSEGYLASGSTQTENMTVTVGDAKRLYIYPTGVSAVRTTPFKVVPGTYDIVARMSDSGMDIVVTEAEAPYQYPDEILLVGHVNGYSWVTSHGVHPTRLSNGVYKFSDVRVNSSGDGNGYFSFVSTLGDNWDIVNSMNRYGSTQNNDPVILGENTNSLVLHAADINASSAPSFMLAEGWYDITVDLNTMKMSTTVSTVEHPDLPEIFPTMMFLIGDVNGYAWKPSQGVVAEGNEGVYVFDNVNITANGKFVGYFSFATRLNEDWGMVNLSDRYGANSLDAPAHLETNLPVRMFTGGGTASSAYSWMIAPGTYKMTLNLNDMTLYILDKSTEIPDIPFAEKIYLIGQVNGTSWNPSYDGAVAPGNGYYKFDSVTIGDSGDGYGYFSIATVLGNDQYDWNTLNTGNRYGPSSDDDGHLLFSETYQYDLAQIHEYTGGSGAGNCKAWKVTPGKYEIIADFTVALPTLIIKKAHFENHDVYEYTTEWFSKEEYIWKSRTRAYHLNNLTEVAYDNDQQMAMVARIYTTRAIPGSKEIRYLGNPKDKGATDTNLVDDEINLLYKYGGENYYEDPNGTGTQLHPVPNVLYPGMEALGIPETDEDGNPIDYSPVRHGVTALLVELNIPEICSYPYIESPAGTPESERKWSTVNGYIKNIYEQFTGMTIENADYTWLFKNTSFYKSISLLTEREYVQSASNPGYIFNVYQPLTHFFIALKGQPRKKNWDNAQTTKFDIFNYFEQISPTNSDISQNAQQEFSAIDRMRKGHKYRVLHDCSSVIYQDHYFCMDRHMVETDAYGAITNLDEAGDYEANDNFFVYIPSARFTYWDRTDTELLEYAAANDINIDPVSYGRDHNYQRVVGGVNTSGPKNAIGAYTYYHPKYAPYFFMYTITLSIDGNRPMIGEEYDPHHYNVDLTWHSSMTEITSAHYDGLTEQYYIYPIVNGVISETPLNINDLASEGFAYIIPADQTEYTSVTTAADGTIIVTSISPEVKITLVLDAELDAPTSTVGYIVSGSVKDDDFIPVFSNDVELNIYGTQTMVPARLNREKTTSKFYVSGDGTLGVAANNNRYVNTIQMFRDPKFPSNLTRGDVVPGKTTFYLMRTDKKDAQGEDTPIAYIKLTDEYSTTDASRGGAVKAYHWKVGQMPGYTDSSLSAWFYMNVGDVATRFSAEKDDTYYFWSPSTGNEHRPAAMSDEQSILYPIGYLPTMTELTNLNGYIEFSDQFDVSVAGNEHPGSYTYYYLYDKEGELYDTTTGDKTPAMVRDPKNNTNSVTVTIPRSAISSSIQTYLSEDVMEDLDHHLPLNSTQMHMAITNIPTLSSFNVYKSYSNTLVGITRRNGERNFETFSVNNRNYTSHGETTDYNDENYAHVKFPLATAPIKNDKYYGVIVSSLGNTYGVDNTPGQPAPTLEILDAKLCHVVEDGTSYNDYPNNYRVGEKWIVPDFSSLEEKYNVEITHFNVWRTVESEHFTGQRTEEIIRYHESDSQSLHHPSNPMYNSFNEWEYFDCRTMEDGRTGYLQKDGVLFNESVVDEDETPVTYYARVYTNITPKAPLSTMPKAKVKAMSPANRVIAKAAELGGKNEIVIAEASAQAKFALTNTTGVEDVTIGAAAELEVRNVGSLTVEIKGEGQIVIYDLYGKLITSINDGESVRRAELPSAGLYIIAIPGNAVKFMVK